jgi:glycosyltransferase XagB
MKLDISIIIPVFNERGNLRPLVERIKKALVEAKLTYELIFVDDRSTDDTINVLKTLSLTHPIKILRKKENLPRGKAQSLLAGFKFASSEIVAMIDGDLQYPPEAIPEMVNKIVDGSDVVVANRYSKNTSFVRKLASSFFRIIFGNLLHGFNIDIQSGLKVFRKEIIERLDIHPSSWMFDLEFLIDSRDAGYKIDSVPIQFAKRVSGEEKISLFRASLEMAWYSLKLKLSQKQIIPIRTNNSQTISQGFHYRGKKFINYTSIPLISSAFYNFTRRQKYIICLIIISLILMLWLNWHITVVVIVAVLTVFYFIDLLFSAFLLYRTFQEKNLLTIDDQEISSFNTDLPIYTVMCPLYHEWKVIPQFIRAMSQLSYPKDKLQVMLLLEEDDKQSIEEISKMNLPSYVETRIVPDSKPKTKPKALNYGLLFARGKYAVIYDAEDIPDPMQLKKSVIAFTKIDPDIICIQAKLSFYNSKQNFLTRIFTAEYSLWFDLILPGLQSLNAPIPLGGTSNHFRVADLVKLHGWDAFNVTEDCDLGMRIAKNGFRTAIIDSETMEEANSKIRNWYLQRSRWIKGYIQTYLVHIREAKSFKLNKNRQDRIIFQLTVGGKVLSMFINPFMWFITLSYFIFRPIVGTAIESFYPAPVLYLGVISLVFGNFLYMYMYMIGCAKKNQWSLVKYALITPIYWLGMSLASWRALIEIVVKPHYWSKTVHGFHLAYRTSKHIGSSKTSDEIQHVLSVYLPKVKTRTTSDLPEYCNILLT